MPDPSSATTSPAATSGRACRHWIGREDRYCGAAPAQRYANTIACAAHTPAALAGEPEPGQDRYCPPARCWCGTCPWWKPYNAYAATADSWTTDARAIASGKRRASPEQQAAARMTVQEQKERERRLRKGGSTAWRLLVTGSRSHPGKALIWHTLDGYHAAHPNLLVVHGECYPPEDEDGNRPDISADWLVHLWCQARGVPDEPHPADWALGRRAGPVRNQEMVDLGADECAGFPLGKSIGTYGCMRMAEQAGIPVRRWTV